ncbi:MULTISPECIES: polyprenyl synthetase family protein [Candidatus Ichthyocystis]|uniref:Putative farnesyl diphosphate synthase n=1 Tax=Candidatus Ichthyocystis hellenicum TaxID=1561003 RepID=A0A0S4M2D0_9BURK|nr:MULTISPECIES: polyprenyl synthetase family protein [Ichthyocystis]CUT16906.1 putative farnesyl diphosphate synthase [Candidatus Ichthyocystis hellenicum]
MSGSYHDWAQYVCSQVYNHLISEVRKKISDDDNQLAKAILYATSNPGRALRPQLVFAARNAVGELPNEEQPLALAIAGSVELIHIMSLIYDDLPCMDNSPTRRGHPSVHKIYGENIAILAADSLKSLAFEQLSTIDSLSYPGILLRLLSYLSQASGYSGICLGQAIDLVNDKNYRNESSVLDMYFLKTGKLIVASIFMGAWSNPHMSEELLEPLSRFAKNLGVSFQIINDLRDNLFVNETGKIPHQDLEQDKNTLLSYHGPQVCARIALDLLEKSRVDAELLPGDSSRFCQILAWVVQQIPIGFRSGTCRKTKSLHET